MNNDALVAALGLDAVGAVHGYRLAVLAEAQQRGLCLGSQALSELVAVTPGVCTVIDPIDIRLAFRGTPGRGELAGKTLAWNPAHGWSLSHRAGGGPLVFYAGPDATPLDLIPTAPQVLDWAASDPPAGQAGPEGVELDDDSAAIRRLLGFLDRQVRFSTVTAFAPVPPSQTDCW